MGCFKKLRGKRCVFHSRHEGANFVGVFDALGAFHARADINRQRQSARMHGTNAFGHVCRCESTRQNEVSIDVCWKL